jgi:hypothetical protein
MIKYTKVAQGEYEAKHQGFKIDLIKLGYDFVGTSTEYEVYINNEYFGNKYSLKEAKEQVLFILNEARLERYIEWHDSCFKSYRSKNLRFKKVCSKIELYRDEV